MSMYFWYRFCATASS